MQCAPRTVRTRRERATRFHGAAPRTDDDGNQRVLVAERDAHAVCGHGDAGGAPPTRALRQSRRTPTSSALTTQKCVGVRTASPARSEGALPRTASFGGSSATATLIGCPRSHGAPRSAAPGAVDAVDGDGRCTLGRLHAAREAPPLSSPRGTAATATLRWRMPGEVWRFFDERGEGVQENERPRHAILALGRGSRGSGRRTANTRTSRRNGG